MRQRIYATNADRQRAYRKRNAAPRPIVTLPTPYYQDRWVTLYCADCLDVLPLLEAASVDLVLTDPPYNVSTSDGEIRLAKRRRIQRDFGTWDYDWQPEPFLAHVARLLRPGGSLLAFTSDRLLSRYLTYPGLDQRGAVVWHKTNPAMQFRPGYMKATEHIAWLARPGAGATWNGGGAIHNFFDMPACAGAERTDHPTQKPLRLVKNLLQLHSNAGDLVIDPYVGSGTTLVAAKLMGRRAIGIERDARYCEIAALRLSQDVMDFEEAA